MAEIDRDQLALFARALFTQADPQSYVSLRAFYEDDSGLPYAIWPVKMAGGVEFLIEQAIDLAQRAAEEPRKVVFCPPVATFSNPDRAREKDLAQGLALSVELDSNPTQARSRLEAVLGPATLIVASGGTWAAPDGSRHDKLHGRWGLSAAAANADAFRKLKYARELVTRLAGGDPSNNPLVHPIRWPGSIHRKAEPRLCRVVDGNLTRRIDLDAAVAELEAAVPHPTNGSAKHSSGNGANYSYYQEAVRRMAPAYPTNSDRRGLPRRDVAARRQACDRRR
jgi:hypothetical protein